MTARQIRGNPLSRVFARLMVAAGTGALDAVLGLATEVRARYTEHGSPPIARRPDWWNVPDPGTRSMPAPARSSRRSRRSFPTNRRS